MLRYFIGYSIEEKSLTTFQEEPYSMNEHPETKKRLDEKGDGSFDGRSIMGLPVTFVEADCDSGDENRDLFGLLGRLPDAAFCMNPHGIIVLSNHAARELVGLGQSAHVVGRSVLEFVHQDSMAAAVAVMDNIRQGRIPGRIELLVRCMNGDKKWIDGRVCLLPYRSEQVVLLIVRDISSSKVIERELKKYQDASRIFMENMDDMMILWDDTLRAVFVNPAVENLLGYKSDECLEILSSPGALCGVMTEESTRVLRERVPRGTLDAVLDGMEKAPIELELLHKDGSHIWTETRIRSIREDTESFSGFVTITRDISSHKQIQGELERSERFLRAVLESTADGILVVDREGRVVHSNERFAGMWRIPDEIVRSGQNARLLEYVSDQLEDTDDFNHEIRDVYLTTRKYFDIRRFKDGRTFEQYSSPLVGDAQERGRVWSFRDITQRELSQKALRESEKRLGLALDGADLHLWELDVPTGELFIQERLLESLGYPVEDVQPHAAFLRQIMHPEDVRTYDDTLRKHLEGHAPSCECSFRVNDAAGQQRWILLRGKITERSGDDSPALMSGTYLDITQQKKAEERRDFYERQLRQSQKMEAIGTLSAGIAHDFNNILGAILLNTELALLEDGEDSPNRILLERVVKASHRAKGLVDQILQFSRQSEQERKPVEIVPLFKETLKMLRSVITSNIEIVPIINTGFVQVMMDPTHICQVLLNLSTNAEHAMRGSGGTLTIELSDVIVDEVRANKDPDLQPGHYLRLSVRDTGTGISPEIRDRIFDPFFTTKGPGEGTGMGLSVVHGIVKSYGGTVHIDSTEGRGSVFEVLLPTVEIEVSPNIAGHARIPGGKEHILLVDDEEDLVNVEREILSHLGYRVTGKTSPHEALDYFRSHAPEVDLVITDMTMPGMLGTDLVAEIRGIRRDIPVILCTGFNLIISPEKARQLNIDDLLFKPVGRRNMAHSIRSILDQRN